MKGWYKALEDLVWLTQLGLNMLLPLVMCLCMVGGEQLELAGMGVPAGHPAGACCRGTELLVFCKGTYGPHQKGKTKAGGVQLASVNLTGGFPL